jgi:hypothetical protein
MRRAVTSTAIAFFLSLGVGSTAGEAWTTAAPGATRRPLAACELIAPKRRRFLSR